MIKNNQRCHRCILPTVYPNVSLDKSGECNYCKRWDQKWQDIDFKKQTELLENILSKFRSNSNHYDCLVGLSGGKDSCYAAYVMKKKNMKILACTFDNGFMSKTTLENINNTVKALSIGHVYVRYDPDYLKTLYRHFIMKAGEFCSVCNVGIVSTLYRIARSYGIKLIVSGQSSRTEANSPKEFFTCSPGYFKNVAETILSRKDIYNYMYADQIKRFSWHIQRSPFYLQLPSYIPWNEDEFIEEIKAKLNWQGAFGEQHKDCRMSDAKEYLKLKQFGVTELAAKLSSLIRAKQVNRDEALVKVQQQMNQLKENENSIREQLMKEFDLPEGKLDEAIQASQYPYISVVDTLLSQAKYLYEKLHFRK